MTECAASISIQLNNNGVQQMAEKNYEGSIAKLAEALDSCKRTMADIMIPLEDKEGCDALGVTPCDASLDCIMARSTQAANMPPGIEEETANDFIYSAGLCVPSFLPLSRKSRTVFSACAIFNLALAYQLKAYDSKDKKRYLKKAARLYELAHNLHRDEELGSVLFAMACVNNLGVISKHLGDLNTSKLCFAHLLSTLMFVLIHDGPQRDIIMGVDGFFKNAASCELGTKTAPAA
eukprot:CAMPEP_0178752662 /NCGR_PEP_ID=MMETSP0744-20121128/11183_1 /TAXON_ID=913974 /ORGANISM="Nitzschia punctata, Strain CCMP561" /LENGTH=234 /DNA_ID=CAMNT_0020406397 /DNA_START=379 /DNA_END=1083 /DNA_ORIENTATION=+